MSSQIRPRERIPAGEQSLGCELGRGTRKNVNKPRLIAARPWVLPATSIPAKGADLTTPRFEANRSTPTDRSSPIARSSPWFPGSSRFDLPANALRGADSV